MRFMLFMIPNITDDEWQPTAEDVARMSEYNGSLASAGVLLSADGLHPPGDGARVTYKGGKPTVTDGPFTEAKELVGGYWIIDVKSKEEAVEWARRVPAAEQNIVEVRQIAEIEEFPPDVQEAAKF